MPENNSEERGDWFVPGRPVILIRDSIKGWKAIATLTTISRIDRKGAATPAFPGLQCKLSEDKSYATDFTMMHVLWAPSAIAASERDDRPLVPPSNSWLMVPDTPENRERFAEALARGPIPGSRDELLAQSWRSRHEAGIPTPEGQVDRVDELGDARSTELKPLSPIKIAFGDLQAGIGIVLTFVSVAALIAHLSRMDLIEIWHRVLEIYHATIHNAFDFVTVNLFGFELAPWVKDLATIYSCLGMVTVRSFSSLYRIHAVSREVNLQFCGLDWLEAIIKRSKAVANIVVWLLWPFVAIRLIGQGEMRYKLIGYGGGDGYEGFMPTFKYKISTVFFLQVLALAVLIVIFLATNAA